jgi:hypothetical protein
MSEHIEPAGMSKTKVVHSNPTLMLDSTDMPEIKDYDVGETYDAILHCKMLSKHQGLDGLYDDDDKHPGIIRGRFEVLSIKPIEGSTEYKGNGKLKAIKKRLD